MAQRGPYYYPEDPNRLFPDGTLRAKKRSILTRRRHGAGTGFAVLFEQIKRRRICILTFTARPSIRSRLSFATGCCIARISPRPRPSRGGGRRLAEMCAAYGHSVVNEFRSKNTWTKSCTVRRRPPRSTWRASRRSPLSWAAGNARSAIVRASAAGLRNVMRWAGMLPGEMEPIAGIRVVAPGFPCRRRAVGRVPQPCIVHHLVEPGDLSSGRSARRNARRLGRPVGEGVLRSEYDGWIISRTHGVVRYPGEATFSMAIRDDSEMVGRIRTTIQG